MYIRFYISSPPGANLIRAILQPVLDGVMMCQNSLYATLSNHILRYQ